MDLRTNGRVPLRIKGVSALDPAKVVDSVFSMCLLATLVLVAFESDHIRWYYKQRFLIPNIALLAAIVLVLTVLGRVRHRVSRAPRSEADADYRPAPGFIVPASLVLLGFQLWATAHLRFITGWDAGGIYADARSLFHGGPLGMHAIEYFSSYPNNLLLLAIEHAAMFLPGAMSRYDGAYALLVAANCLISTIASVLVYLIGTRWAGRRAGAVCWVLFALLIGVSPWVFVVYSDSLTLAIPVGILAAYVLVPARGVGRVARWAVIGGLTALGYALKPQCVFMTMAIILAEAVALGRRVGSRALRQALRSGTEAGASRRNGPLSRASMPFSAASFITALVVVHLACSVAVQPVKVEIDPDDNGAFTPVHYAMMGLNPRTDGGYDTFDVRFSRGFVDPHERLAAEVGVIADRLEWFGPLGLARHLVRKQLTTWADGTFAWGAEGGFWRMPVLMHGNPATDGLYNLYVRGDLLHRRGRSYRVFATGTQAVWLFVLEAVAMGTMPVGQRHRAAGGEHVAGAFPRPRGFRAALVSILFLMAFELVFEARARYLYIYAPVLVLLAGSILAAPCDRRGGAPGRRRAQRAIQSSAAS